MNASTTAPRFDPLHREADPAVRDELLAGLRQDPAAIAPKYFYDTLGSRLFEAITELPEYYPTRTEAAILAAHRDEIAQVVGPGTTLIDLGAGNCAKAARLFTSLRPERYVAVDISADFVREALQRLQREHPGIEMSGVGLDFSNRLDLPAWCTSGRPLFFYPGSSIGNFQPAQALTFLEGVRARARHGGLLIGVDLVKPAEVLEAAYDDALGVTAAFNLNVLRRVNQLAGTDFVLAQWRHVALFNSAASRVEMHLEARAALTVRWSDGLRHFPAGERIHTENSYKYTPSDFAALLEEAGFTAPRCWTDPAAAFAVFHARA